MLVFQGVVIFEPLELQPLVPNCNTQAAFWSKRWSICSWKTRCVAGQNSLELELNQVDLFTDPRKAPTKISKITECSGKIQRDCHESHVVVCKKR